MGVIANYESIRGFQGVTVVKTPPANAGDLSLGQEDPPGEGHGNPLQYSCLENPMDREAWSIGS